MTHVMFLILKRKFSCHCIHQWKILMKKVFFRKDVKDFFFWLYRSSAPYGIQYSLCSNNVTCEVFSGIYTYLHSKNCGESIVNTRNNSLLSDLVCHLHTVFIYVLTCVPQTTHFRLNKCPYLCKYVHTNTKNNRKLRSPENHLLSRLKIWLNLGMIPVSTRIIQRTKVVKKMSFIRK